MGDAVTYSDQSWYGSRGRQSVGRGSVGLSGGGRCVGSRRTGLAGSNSHATSLRSHFMRAILPILALFCLPFAGPGCGILFYDHEIKVAVDFLPADSPYLGFTFHSGANRWKCAIRADVLTEPDEDKATRVLVHELLQIVVLISDGLPAGSDGWYAASGDTQEPNAIITNEEADWVRAVIKSYPKISTFEVGTREVDLLPVVVRAVERLREAGLEMFEED